MPIQFLAESYLHTIDPVAFRIGPAPGGLPVRWYGLAYVAGFVIAWLVVRLIAGSERSPLKPAAVADLMFYAIIGVLLGGRLGYAIFYEPSLFIRFTGDLPYWDLLAIQKGGMASHGGMLGVLLAAWLFARRQRVPTLHVLDVGAVACTPGLFFGRLANFINGELLGRPMPDQDNPAPWSVKFPQEMHRWIAERDPRLPDLRGIVPEVGIAPDDWEQAARSLMGPEPATQESLDLLQWGAHQLVMAVQRGNEYAVEFLNPMLTARYPSQIFQAIAEGPLLLAVLLAVWWRPRKPGVVGGSFLIAYGILRIITESFREPDEGLALVLGLSRGQMLSALMVLAGIVVVWWCARRDQPALGGLHPAR